MTEELKSGTKMALATFPVASILARVHLAKESLVLSIKSGEVIKNIFIKQGEAVFANSNAKSDNIKTLLLKDKKISETQIAAIENKMKATGAKFIETMVSLGYWPNDKVEDLRARHVMEIITDCHAMTQGSCEIIRNDSIFSKITQYKTSLHLLVAEGVKRHMTLAAIEQLMSDLSPENYFLLLPKWEDDKELGKIMPEEKGLLTIISSSPKIEEVFSSTFLKKDEVFKYLYCLRLFGFIDIETESARMNRELEKSLTPENRTVKKSLVALLDETDKKTYYEILDVLKDASQSELDQALARLKSKFDPVKYSKLFWGQDKDIPQRLLNKITYAHSILSDARKRTEYNSFVDRGEAHKFAAASAMLLREEPLKLAREAAARKDYAGAAGFFSKALEFTPDDTDLLAMTAGAIFRAAGASNTQEINRALSMLKKAFEKNPDNYFVFLEFGFIFKGVGKAQQAADSFKKAILLNPNCKEAVAELNAIDPKNADMTRIRGIFKSLEKMNYYQLLDIERSASSDDIKKAYHSATKRYHPDRHFSKGDEDLQDMTKAIYKRIVEAYMVLKTPQKRKEYDDQLGVFKAEAEKEIRLKDAADVVQKKEKSEITFKTSHARRFFELGLTSLSQKRLNAAKINFQLALKAEPDNVNIQRKLKEVMELEKANDI